MTEHQHTEAQPHMHEDYDFLKDVFTYHPPREGQVEMFERLRNAGYELADLIRTLCPPVRETDIAIDTVRSAIMWANAALAIHGAHPDVVPNEVLKFFGDLNADQARALKAAWQDMSPDAKEDAEAAQTPEGTPPAITADGVCPCSNPAETHPVSFHDEHPQTFGEKPAAQEVYDRDDERIGALSITPDGTCGDCGADIAPTGNILENGNDLVCLNCGRTGAYSLIEEPTDEEQNDAAPKGCPECGMHEAHVHIDDKTFLGDENGPEIKVLTGMQPLMEHHGVVGVPYVLIDETLPDDTFRLESGTESKVFDINTGVEVDPRKGVDAQNVASIVEKFLSTNPNAMFEPIGGRVTDWINRGRDLVRTVVEEQAGVPQHNHPDGLSCQTNCPRAQWERNR